MKYVIRVMKRTTEGQLLELNGTMELTCEDDSVTDKEQAQMIYDLELAGNENTRLRVHIFEAPN